MSTSILYHGWGLKNYISPDRATVTSNSPRALVTMGCYGLVSRLDPPDADIAVQT
jgi:hypothetical protein